MAKRVRLTKKARKEMLRKVIIPQVSGRFNRGIAKVRDDLRTRLIQGSRRKIPRKNLCDLIEGRLGDSMHELKARYDDVVHVGEQILRELTEEVFIRPIEQGRFGYDANAIQDRQIERTYVLRSRCPESGDIFDVVNPIDHLSEVELRETNLLQRFGAICGDCETTHPVNVSFTKYMPRILRLLEKDPNFQTSKAYNEFRARHRVYSASTRVKGGGSFLNKLSDYLLGINLGRIGGVRGVGGITDALGLKVGVQGMRSRNMLRSRLERAKFSQGRLILLSEKDAWNKPRMEAGQKVYQGLKLSYAYALGDTREKGVHLIEVQLQTPPMQALDMRSHPSYEERKRLARADFGKKNKVDIEEFRATLGELLQLGTSEPYAT